MVNQKRDFEPALLEELKHFYRCTQKDKNPNHFCTQSELAKNLKMSLRDVGRTLHDMTSHGLVKHDKVKQNGRLKDRFIPTNERLYESAQMIKDTENVIKSHLVNMRKLAVKMRDKPAIHSIKFLPEIEDMRFLTHPKVIDKVRNTTGKFDKIGLSYLDDFCFMVNNIFSYIDSMQYATYDDSIEANEKTEIVIKNLRIKTVTEFNEILEYMMKPYSKKVAKAVLEMIKLKIPMIFMLTQYQQMSKVMM